MGIMRINTLTKYQSNPTSQGSCKFGGQHSMASPIYRNGIQVSPVVDDWDDGWFECSTCGRIEDSHGDPILDVPFERCAR
jgi:hypothetical protein